VLQYTTSIYGLPGQSMTASHLADLGIHVTVSLHRKLPVCVHVSGTVGANRVEHFVQSLMLTNQLYPQYKFYNTRDSLRPNTCMLIYQHL